MAARRERSVKDSSEPPYSILPELSRLRRSQQQQQSQRRHPGETERSFLSAHYAKLTGGPKVPRPAVPEQDTRG